MNSYDEPFDFDSSPPHPLTYASLVPWHSCKSLRRLDLHKPKSTYTLGRAPSNDFAFDSLDISWQFGTLVWDSDHKVCLNLHESSVSSVWINYKQLLPGQSHVLKQGDQIRIGTVEYKRHSDTFSVRDKVYVFHQFTSEYAPNLLPEHLVIRKRLDELDRERVQLMQALPSIPAVSNYNFFEEYNELYRDRDSRRWPDDPRIDQPDCEEHIRTRFGTVAYNSPPPIRSAADVRLRYGYEGESADGIDWNDPDLIWKGNLYLNRSRPLTIPVSMIHWSNMHQIPVYRHPGFDPASTVTTAYPHAAFSANFSDESAALNRAEVGLPPLENAAPIRPSEVVQSFPTSDELPGLLKTYLQKKADQADMSSNPPTRPSSPTELTLTRSPSTASSVKRRRLKEGREDSLREDAGGGSPKRRKASLPPVHTPTSPSFTDSSQPASATLPVCASPRDSDNPEESTSRLL